MKMRSVLLSVLPLFAVACGPDEPPPEQAGPSIADVVTLSEAEMRAAGIGTEVIAPSTMHREVEVPGSVQPPDTAQGIVGSIVEGRVVAVRVLPGDVVRAGDPLVEIHAHEVAEAQRDITAAEAQLSFHQNAHQRSLELYEAGAVSLEEVERRNAALEAARAELRRAEEMVEHLEPSPDGNATAAAPRDGTIFEVNARMGQAVLPGTPLVTMGRTDILWVTAFVPERTASTLEAGDTVRVRFEGLGSSVQAHMVRAANFVDPANRSVEMRFELESVPNGVRPGSFAVVDVASADSFEGVELPAEATARVGARDVVFVAEEAGRYRAVDVEVVHMRDGLVGVTGVPVGAEVVVEGAYFLKAALELAEEGPSEGGDAP